MEPHPPSSRPKRVMVPDASENGLPRLSCKRCRARKVKCDGQWPSCIGCSKSGSPCVVADPTASRDYTQVEVRQMQDRLRRLESLLGAPALRWSDLPLAPSPERQPAPSPSKTAPDPRVAPQTGSSLFRSLLDSMKKRSSGSAQLPPAPPHASFAFNLDHAPHRLPLREVGLQCVREYFREFHVEHPFLSRSRVFGTLAHIYDNAPAGRTVPVAASPPSAAKQKLFQLNMVLAIGSIPLFRTGGISLHPFGFFTAALRAKPPSGSHFGEIEDIENFLLIAYFGIYYNIGCSVWELCRLCMRICVELQLHRRSPNTPAYSPAEEQRRRRVFWECYSLDRFASGTLGRPLAINDSMITAELPEALADLGDDETSIEAGNADYPPPRQTMDLAVSNHLLHLAQITSEIHYLFQPQAPAPSAVDGTHTPARQSSWSSKPGDVYPILLACHRKLKDWLDSAPRYDSPDCVALTAEFFELAYQKERLGLFRSAIDRFSDSMPSPPEVLLNSCVHGACRTISIFDSLRRRGLLTCTRPHTHHVFTTGLVLIFSVFVQIQRQGHRDGPGSEIDLGVWWAELDNGAGAPGLARSLEALGTAGSVLSWFAEQMPDMDAHARVFETLRQELGEIVKNHRSGDSEPSSSLPGPHSTHTDLGNRFPLNDMIPPLAYPGGLHTDQPLHFHEAASTPVNAEGSGLPMDSRGTETGQLPGPSSPSGFLAGILQNNSSVNAGHMDVSLSSWPFSSMPWMEGIEPRLSGYEWEMIYSGLSPLEDAADMDMIG